MPMFIGDVPDGPPASSSGDVPARINKALEFLGMLQTKQMNRAAVAESQIQIIDGQKLTEEETATQCTALNLLNQYFAGKLQPDAWEAIKVEALTNRNKNKKAISGKLRALACPACGGNPGDQNCPLCEGKGTLVIVSGSGGSNKRKG